MNAFTISGNIVDIPNKRIFKGEITINNGRIENIIEKEHRETVFLLPGFVDAHVHIESSMLVPSEFARLAVVHGTVSTVSDPHEIANVCGMEGIRFMIGNGAEVPFKFNFGAPSCVPATPFETSGAVISTADIETLLQLEEVKYLSEMMNWPGVLYRDALVYEKIGMAQKYRKPIDGHAPGLRGKDAAAYAGAGISTDHECFSREEALDKLACGMKILIREGSAARNFDALIGLLHDHEDDMMFCSDDKHPDSLVEGHINTLVKRSVEKGIDIFKALKAACVNPVKHYQLPVGQLKLHDPADFIVADNLKDFRVLQTYINGHLVASEGKTLIPRVTPVPVNNFKAAMTTPENFSFKSHSGKVRTIEAMDGQIVTRAGQAHLEVLNGFAQADVGKDILKITVVNRYSSAPPAVAFVKGFGLRQGAIASSVAHDCHNIIAAGADDEALSAAVNEVVRRKGGIAAISQGKIHALSLPVAGLMSVEDGYEVAEAYTRLDRISKEMGSQLESPFMTLSFMALLVIPSLKLSDKGLFDGERFEFVDPRIE